MWFSIIILLTVIQSSYQVIYPCNPWAVCGCSTNPVSITRIVEGEDAATATWGWAVSIYLADTYLCAGSIISNSWVITAAHCVNRYTASQIRIYAGSIFQGTGTQSRVSSQIIMHPFYQPDTYVNDIALLRLSFPLSMNDPSIGVICIPSVASAILSAGEWPPAGTTVSDYISSKFTYNFSE
jgi:secreted trypsin-like serine protease